MQIIVCPKGSLKVFTRHTKPHTLLLAPWL